MSKIKLVKRSENVNVIYSNNGQKKEELQSVEYKVLDEETGEEIGEANVHQSNFNLNVYSGITSINDAKAIVEKMFGSLAE